MSLYNTDTIAAIATPPGEGGVGIVRISGPQVWAIADSLFQALDKTAVSERDHGTFSYGKVVDSDGSEIDTGLALVMRAPNSYTREDVVEIQGHGGAVGMRRILRRALDAGARMAEPGEFTKRAFLNGRIDLVQAEGIFDLIRARSDRAASAAMEQMGGGSASSLIPFMRLFLKWRRTWKQRWILWRTSFLMMFFRALRVC